MHSLRQKNEIEPEPQRSLAHLRLRHYLVSLVTLAEQPLNSLPDHMRQPLLAKKC